MNTDLLKTRLHIDQIQLWREVVELLKESRIERNSKDGDFSREYYISLITKILEGFQKEVPKYNKSIQTGPSETDSDNYEILGKIENCNNKLLEYYDKISNLSSYAKGDNTLHKVCLEEENFGWNSQIKLLKNMKFQENDEFLQRFLEVLKKRELLLKNVISTQHSMLMLLKDINWVRKDEESYRYKFKSQEYEDSMMKKEIEKLKSQNQLLNLRIELYQAEISRLVNKK